MDILPEEFLQLMSPRLLLRPLEEDDVDLVVKLVTDPEMMEYAGGPATSERIRSEMKSFTQRGADGSIGVWCICNAETQESIGTIALLPLPVKVKDTEWELVRSGEMPERDIEIGYFLSKNEWGQGFASEAVSRILEFAFSIACLEEIVAVIDPQNRASRNVLERTGFSKEGDRSAYKKTSLGFRITKLDWLKLSRADKKT